LDVLTDTELGRQVVARVGALVNETGGAQLRVHRTQTGWARRRYFAVLWSPQRWLGERAALVVLTVYLPQRLDSARFKEVVQVRPGLWAHHLEIQAVTDIDDEVASWLAQAWDAAG
jgi:hypothetical protein